VDLQATGDASGGYNVGWTHAGEWLAYTANFTTSGTYVVSARVASPRAGAAFHVEIDGANVTGSLAIPGTGGWQSYTTVTAAVPTYVTAGVHVVKLVFDANNADGYAGNVNWLKLSAASSPPPPPAPEQPYGGTPAAIPGVVQAENFDTGGEGVAYHDTDGSNNGGQYRPADGVDIEWTGDAGGGYDVGWTHAGEWLKYTIAVPTAGAYTLDARVADVGAGATFHVEFNGVDATGPLSVPNTGAWQSYQDVVADGIPLAAGTYTMKVSIDANAASGFAGNFNWFKLTPAVAVESPKNLLFFGNSFTLYNNVPSLVADVAQAEGHPRPNVYTQANYGWNLTDHLNKLTADGSANIIQSSLPAGASWSDVVYQDYSTRPLNDTAAPVYGDPAGFRRDAAALLQQVHAYSPGVVAVPLETWARGYDNTTFYPAAYSEPGAMQYDLFYHYTQAANDAAAAYGPASVSLAKVGEGWRALNWQRDLYDGPDEYHPSPKGSMLDALIVYRAIYHSNVSAMPAATLNSFLAAHSLSPTDWSQISAAADSVA
jgi:hypothetical protein